MNRANSYIYSYETFSCIWQIYTWFKDKYMCLNSVAHPTNWQRGWQVFTQSLFNSLLNDHMPCSYQNAWKIYIGFYCFHLQTKFVMSCDSFCKNVDNNVDIMHTMWIVSTLESPLNQWHSIQVSNMFFRSVIGTLPNNHYLAVLSNIRFSFKIK